MRALLRFRAGFTLIELLVVIAIIGILASMILPVLSRIKTQAKKQTTKLEIGKMAVGITKYQTDTGHYPVSSAAMNAAVASGEDFTFGTYGLAPFATPAGGTVDVLSPDINAGNASYQTNNAEVIAILLDLEYYGNGNKTVNFGHVKNTQHTAFLTIDSVSDTTSPGVGRDGVFRDAFGMPYVITMDLNNDGKARDAFYRVPGISADASDSGTPKHGLDGLHANTNGTSYELSSPIMIWSAGPDKQIDKATPANQGANKDNIRNWK